MQRTKIVATIGPASRAPEQIAALIDNGMDVVRLNFSHGTREEHAEVIANVRRLAERAGAPIAILQDLRGPKIRIGSIAQGTVQLEPGQTFTLTTRAVPGDAREVSVSHASLPEDVRPGDRILLADGAIELEVASIGREDVECRVIVGGPLSSHKGLNLPARSLRVPSLTDEDREDVAFGIAQGVDFIAMSFVRSPGEVRELKQLLQARAASIPVIAKIEKHEALDCLEAIAAEADGLMVARGDLGVEVPLERVPRIQKLVIEHANRLGKPVITATQMLRSMVESPRPTRAEVTDVANAILDGTDAVMLSEETAVGAHAVAAVAMMARIAAETEQGLPPARERRVEEPCSLPDAVAHAACRLADEIRAAALITFTESGGTARLVAKHRPRPLVFALTPIASVYRQLALSFGVVPLLSGPIAGTDEMIARATQAVLATGLVHRGDRVVMTAGVPVGKPGTTNLIKVAEL